MSNDSQDCLECFVEQLAEDFEVFWKKCVALLFIALASLGITAMYVMRNSPHPPSYPDGLGDRDEIARNATNLSLSKNGLVGKRSKNQISIGTSAPSIKSNINITKGTNDMSKYNDDRKSSERVLREFRLSGSSKSAGLKEDLTNNRTGLKVAISSRKIPCCIPQTCSAENLKIRPHCARHVGYTCSCCSMCCHLR